MPDLTKPVVVPSNAGPIDGLTAAGRYVVVVATLFPALLAVLKDKDIVALHAFVTGEQGAALIAAVVGLGTMAYGIIKTFRRGKQSAQIAADPRVPPEVARTS